MADLVTDFAGIRCPNPFWLASGPPTNSGEQIMRAFDAGWGGAVWKTIGEPIVNVSSRYSSVDWNGQRMMGLNNIELISDRSIATNLREIADVKRRYPHHAVIASLMVDSQREVWHDIVQRTEDAGADGLELNFGCPHGMSERGMGSAVGQVPEYTCMITQWVKEVARTPVIVKLTPNITDIRDRKSTRLNSSHLGISYAVFCLKAYGYHRDLHSFPTRRSSDLTCMITQWVKEVARTPVIVKLTPNITDI